MQCGDATCCVVPRGDATCCVVPRGDATCCVVPRGDATCWRLNVAVLSSAGVFCHAMVPPVGV